MNKKFLTISFLTLLGTSLQAQENTTKQDSIKSLNEVSVNGINNKYKRVQSTTVSKMPLSDIENPQVYNTVTAELLKEQAVNTFSEALKNATGVSRLWESTGRSGDGGEFFTIRGFAVQPTMINGLPAITNGSIDPSNIDAIEVIKGPSGTLFGSSLISYGGLINISTKKPNEKFGGEVTYNTGTYSLDRVTADVNVPLNEQKTSLLRINTALQEEKSFQDAGFNKLKYIAPSYTYKANDRLTFMINTEFGTRESANAPMLFLTRYALLSFGSMDLFYKNYNRSFTSNELTIRNNSYSVQAQAFYKLSDQWTSQTALSSSYTKTSGFYSYLNDRANGNEFDRWMSDRNGHTTGYDIQQNFIGDFKIGEMRNRLVVGLDYYSNEVKNEGNRGWISNGVVSLVDGTDSGDLTKDGVNAMFNSNPNELNSYADTKIYSAYASNVINITPRLSAMASLRVDNFSGKVNYYSGAETKSQTALSPKFGLMYQPIEDQLSVFANYMNGFKNTEPLSNPMNPGAKPQAFDPEHANQLEFGAKANLFEDKLSATVSYYSIEVKDRVAQDYVNTPVQGDAVKSKGVEISIIANPIKGLNIITGFSHNESEQTRDVLNQGYLGLRPEEAGPKNLVNFWASYTLTEGNLKGLGLGFGGNHASEQKTLNRHVVGTFVLPSYTVLNSSLFYNTNKFTFTLKVNNILDDKYFTGWSTVTAQRTRNVNAGVAFKF